MDSSEFSFEASWMKSDQTIEIIKRFIEVGIQIIYRTYI